MSTKNEIMVTAMLASAATISLIVIVHQSRLPEIKEQAFKEGTCSAICVNNDYQQQISKVEAVENGCICTVTPTFEKPDGSAKFIQVPWQLLRTVP